MADCGLFHAATAGGAAVGRIARDSPAEVRFCLSGAISSVLLALSDSHGMNSPSTLSLSASAALCRSISAAAGRGAVDHDRFH